MKLFDPSGAEMWLLTEINPANEDVALGLCDPRLGCPELGSVSLSELAGIRACLGLGLKGDLHFKTD